MKPTPARGRRGGAIGIALLLSWHLSSISAVAGPPPVITTQPTNQTVQVGGTATFVVQATSGTTLSYQWYFQTNAIPGATNNVYTRGNVQLTDAGAYYAAVMNADGMVNSSNAILMVFTITTNSTSSGMTPVGGETSLTWSHTINSGNNRALFVGMSIQNGSSSTSVTYGGMPMTLVGRSNGTHTVEIWKLVAPTVGTANIVATFSGTLQVVGGAAAFNGVNQTTPNGNFVGAAGNSTTPSVMVPSAAGELVLDTLFANDGPTATPGGGQIAQWNLATGSGGGKVLGAGGTEAGAAAVTNTWTLSSSVEWQIGAVSIKSALRPGTAIWRSSGDTSPNTARWNGSSFGASADTATVGQWRIIDGTEAPTRDEKIIVGVDTAGVISGEIYSGGIWSALPFAMASGRPSTEHGFDVAYESISGNALLVWNNGTTGTGNVTYRVWNGSAWSAAQTVPTTLASSAVQVKLAADPNSDTIIMQVCNEASHDYAIVWNGSIWTNGITLGTATSLESTDAAIAVEAQSGHALSVYDDTLAGTILDYRTWNGVVWSAAGSIAAPAGVVGDPAFVSLASDPTSSRVALAVLTSSSEAWFAVWDGNAWDSHLLATSSSATALSHDAAVAFESRSGRLLATYGRAGSTAVRYRTWTSGSGWSAEQTGPNLGGVPNAMTLSADPDSDLIMLAVQDANRDLHYVQWDGTAWRARNTLDLNTGETANQPFLFLYGDLVSRASFADVVTAKSGPSNVFATTNLSYTITVTNRGPSTATNVVVSDTLPAGINVVSVSGGGTVVGGGPGQVMFDSASSNNINGTLTWTHVTTNAANRLMLVGVSYGSSGAASNSAVAAITYGGANLIKVLGSTNTYVQSTNRYRVSEVWQLVNPPSGTHTVDVTLAGSSTNLVAGAATFIGVDQTTPLSAVSSDKSLSMIASVTLSSAANEIVFDNVVCDDVANASPGTGQTQLWNIRDAQRGGASIMPGTNSVTMSWNVPLSYWADVAASVKAAGLIGMVNWTIPTLAGGATTNFTITVTAPLSGTLTNTVSSTADTADSNPANNDGSAAAARVVTPVLPVADLVTTQSGPTSVPPLTNYTYTVTVSNQGPCTASGVVVSDTLAPMLTFVDASGGGTYLAGVVTWPALASLAKGGTADFTVTVRSPFSGLLTNTASSSSASSDPNPANSNGSAPAAQVVTVVSPLEIADTSKGASVQTLNWPHTISPGSARILVVGVSIDNPTNAILSARLGNLLPLTLIGQTNGAQTRVAMYYLINPPVGNYPVSINLASASGIVGGAVSFNGVNQTNPIAGFAGNAGTGTNASLTLASALGAMVVDTVAPKSPQYATNPGPAQTLEWNLSAANYSGAGSSSPGAAIVSPSWALDGAAAWAMGAVAINPATVLADVTLGATGPDNVPATSNLTYSITVINFGSAMAANVVVSDVLPAGTTFVGASGAGTNNAGVVTWPTLTNFLSGTRTNYTVTVTAPSAGTLTNIVYSTAFTADPDPSNNNGTATSHQVVTTVTPLADIVTAVTGPASVPAGATFSYTVTLTNAGPSAASAVVVSDALPAGATFVSASDDGTLNAGVVTWPVLELLDSGATASFTVTVTAPPSGALINTVASTSATADLVPSNNDGSAPAAQVLTTVTPVADLATTVSGPASVVTNAPFRYLVAVANLGPSDATGVAVSDTLPAGTMFVSASDGGTLNAGVVTWSLDSLTSGSGTNFTVTVSAPVLGSLTNTVSSSAVTGDPDLSNNDGSAVAARVVTGVYPFLSLTGQQLPSGGFQVEFHTYPDTIYSILASTNLADWVTLITTNSGDGHVIFIDQDVAIYPQRFYRSRQ